MEKGGESLLLVAGEIPDDEGDADAVHENGIKIVEVEEAAMVNAGVADTGEALEFGSGDVFQEPVGEVGGKNVEICALGFGEMAETTSAGDFGGGAGKEFVEEREVGSRFGDGFGKRGWSGANGRQRRFVEKFDFTALEPEFNFVVAILGLGGHLEEENFDFLATIEIVNDGVSELGKRTGADVAFDAVFILVHDEMNVGFVEVSVKTLMGGGEIVGSGFGGGPIENLVAGASEVTAPVGDRFAEFGATGNDDCFHANLRV